MGWTLCARGNSRREPVQDKLPSARDPTGTRANDPLGVRFFHGTAGNRRAGRARLAGTRTYGDVVFFRSSPGIKQDWFAVTKHFSRRHQNLDGSQLQPSKGHDDNYRDDSANS